MSAAQAQGSECAVILPRGVHALLCPGHPSCLGLIFIILYSILVPSPRKTAPSPGTNCVADGRDLVSTAQSHGSECPVILPRGVRTLARPPYSCPPILSGPSHPDTGQNAPAFSHVGECCLLWPVQPSCPGSMNHTGQNVILPRWVRILARPPTVSRFTSAVTQRHW